MFGCKTDVTSSSHPPEGIQSCFHVCCLPGSWGYPISHSNRGNRKSWKADFCGFLFCPMPEPVTWIRLLVALSFLFNNYFIFLLQKPVFTHCNLLIRFLPHHWSPVVPRNWVIQETKSLDYRTAGIQYHCTPHSSALQRVGILFHTSRVAGQAEQPHTFSSCTVYIFGKEKSLRWETKILLSQ